MANLVEDFFAEREITLTGVEVIRKALKRGRSLPQEMATLLRKHTLPGRPEGQLKWFFRGQSDASWSLSSSLYRAMRREGPVTEHALAATEKAILRVMRDQGLGHHMNDGELLMVLQHHGIPTRLVDVSNGFLPAFWFATEHSDARDGRVFVLGLRSDANGGHPGITLGENKALPWAGAAIGKQYSSRAWSQSLMVVDDPSLDPRMRAQKGRFLVGGLTRRYAGENWPVGKLMLPAADWPEISTLRILFPLTGAKKKATDRWPAVGWTLRIPAALKPAIRAELVKHNYTPNHMYPDFDGSTRLGVFVANGAEL